MPGSRKPENRNCSGSDIVGFLTTTLLSLNKNRARLQNDGICYKFWRQLLFLECVKYLANQLVLPGRDVYNSSTNWSLGLWLLTLTAENKSISLAQLWKAWHPLLSQYKHPPVHLCSFSLALEGIWERPPVAFGQPILLQALILHWIYLRQLLWPIPEGWL